MPPDGRAGVVPDGTVSGARAAAATTAFPGASGAAGASGGDIHGGLEVRDGGGVTAVRFWGSIDLTVRERGTGALAGLRSDPSPLTLDCRDVAFMDSTGLSVLVRILQDAAADGRHVRFLGASAPVRHLLEVTGVDQLMTAMGVRPDA